MRKKKVSTSIKVYRIARFFYTHHMKLIAHFFYKSLYLALNCVIPPSADLKKGVEIAHSVGIVIHDKAVIGENTKIYQNVTIGGGPRRISKNCLIGAGAVVLADLGDNVKVGANAVVLEDVESNSTAVGVPARIIPHSEAKEAK